MFVLYIFVDVQTSVMNWTFSHGPVRCIFVYQLPPVDAVTCIILKNCMWNICIKNVVDVRLWCFTWLLSRHTVVWWDIQFTVCLFVCTFTDFSAAEKASSSSVKLCVLVHRPTKSPAYRGRLPHFGLHLPLTRCIVKISTFYKQSQFPFNSTAKITPRMHQNSPFWAQKSKNFLGRGHSPLPRPHLQWGGDIGAFSVSVLP